MGDPDADHAGDPTPIHSRMSTSLESLSNWDSSYVSLYDLAARNRSQNDRSIFYAGQDDIRFDDFRENWTKLRFIRPIGSGQFWARRIQDLSYRA
jgi:hypothetical protein